MRGLRSAVLPVLAMAAISVAAQVNVRGAVQVLGNKGPVHDRSGAVVWLQPVDPANTAPPEPRTFRLTQKDKHFSPHLLVVPLGSSVEFPNHDPFFHNVFSVYDGTRFDLGLYEAGTSKLVKFSRPGVSYIFCNIHPEMSAVVLALTTPYYAVSNAGGEFAVENVLPGEYEMKVWYEPGTAAELARLSRRIKVGDTALRLDAITIRQAPSLAEGHKNKFGQSYPPAPSYKVP